MEAGWHFYRTEEIFHCFNSGECGFFEIGSAWNVKYIGCELCEAFRVYFVDIACPASPDSCESGSVGDVVDSAEFVFKLVACPVSASCTASGQAVVGEASGPHDFCSGAVVVRLFHEDSRIVDDSLHERFADAVSDFHGFDIDEIAFHCVHQNVYTSAFSLILWECVGEAWV